MLQRNTTAYPLILPTLDPPIELAPGETIDHPKPLAGCEAVIDTPAPAPEPAPAPAPVAPAPAPAAPVAPVAVAPVVLAAPAATAPATPAN